MARQEYRIMFMFAGPTVIALGYFLMSETAIPTWLAV
jgi:hypothetical protein